MHWNPRQETLHKNSVLLYGTTSHTDKTIQQASYKKLLARYCQHGYDGRGCKETQEDVVIGSMEVKKRERPSNSLDKCRYWIGFYSEGCKTDNLLALFESDKVVSNISWFAMSSVDHLLVFDHKKCH